MLERLLSRYVFVCPECGSDQVHALEWIDPNTNDIMGGNLENSAPSSHWWCTECEENFEAITVDRRNQIGELIRAALVKYDSMCLDNDEEFEQVAKGILEELWPS